MLLDFPYLSRVAECVRCSTIFYVGAGETSVFGVAAESAMWLGKSKVRTEKQSELAAKHSKLNELTPRQTEKITAAKQTLQIDGAGYVRISSGLMSH